MTNDRNRIASLDLNDAVVRARIMAAIDYLRGGAQGPARPEFRQAAARYLGFIRNRYVRASRGDGTWQALALSTRRAKLLKIAPARLRKLVTATGAKTKNAQMAALLASRPFPILRDTNTLFGSLTEGAPGSGISYTHDSVTVGTAVKYAKYHQQPSIPGRPPQRLILVPPDGATEEAISRDLAFGILKAFGEQVTAPAPPPPGNQ